MALPRNITGCMLALYAHIATAGSCGPPSLETLDAIVSITYGDGAASGIVIAPDRVLTALHVAHDAVAQDATMTVTVRGEERTVAAVDGDPTSDLALLTVPTGDVTPIPASPRVNMGAAVWAVGFPHGFTQTLTRGYLKSISANGWLLSDAWTGGGHSGGALLRCNGAGHDLVGMIHGYLRSEHPERGPVNTGTSASAPVNKIVPFVANRVSGASPSNAPITVVLEDL